MNKETLSALLAALAAGCNFERKSTLDEKLENLPPPIKEEEEFMGADCYVVDFKFLRHDHVCPVCGEKTIWPKNFEPTPAWQPCAACHGKEGAS